MAAVPHVLEPLSRPPRSRTGKIPYVELPDGTVLYDSGLIIAELTRRFGADLDADLDPAGRARGHAIRRLVEDSLYWVGAWERWVPGFAHTRRDYFTYLPAPLRVLVPIVARRHMLANLHGHGLGRHRPEDIRAVGVADVEALSVLIGDGPYVLGDHPRVVDATVFAFLWAFSSNPFPSPLGDAIKGHPNLVAYAERMRARYWSG
jgi:glutathione S-transferase